MPKNLFPPGTSHGPVQGHEQYKPYRQLTENLVCRDTPAKVNDLWNNKFETIDGKPSSVKR